MSLFVRCIFLVILFVSIVLPSHGDEFKETYGVNPYGELNEPEGFQYFSGVNAEAPQGGILQDVTFSKFTTFNPFWWLAKGKRAPNGISRFLFERLLAGSPGEATASYGRLAKSIIHNQNWSRITFVLHPKAAFSDGSPVTGGDVAHSFKLIAGSIAYYQSVFKNVSMGEVTENSIEFIFNNESLRANKSTVQEIGEMIIFPEKNYPNIESIKNMGLQVPIGSGPYTVGNFKKDGTAITFVKRPDYWAHKINLNTAKGLYNFNEVRMDYYSDLTSARESFLKGEIDYWYSSYEKSGRWSSMMRSSQLKKNNLQTRKQYDKRFPRQMALVFNYRIPFLKDWRVRRALSLTIDFPYINKNYFNSSYQKSDHYFFNKKFQEGRDVSQSVASVLRKTEDVDGVDSVLSLPRHHSFDKKMRNHRRKNLLRALKLLNKAGWSVKDLKLVDKDGTQMVLNVFESDFGNEAFFNFWEGELKRLGIKLNLRIVDSAHRVRILRESPESFHVFMGFFPTSSAINIGSLKMYWHSSNAKKPTQNVSGVQDPQLDKLIDEISTAQALSEWEAAGKAFGLLINRKYYSLPLGSSTYDATAYSEDIDIPKESSYWGFSFQKRGWSKAEESAK